MDISKEHREIIVNEFLLTVKFMRGCESAEEKMFYFSSIYGVISRIFNLEYDPQLIFAHFVLNNAYGNIKSRIDAIKRGDQLVMFPGEYFDKLTGYVERLASQIEKDEDISSTLSKITVLTFLTTGNGYYLFKKGMLKI